jgi:hypothetical protein
MCRILLLVFLAASSAAAASDRATLTTDTVFYVRPDGNNGNSGLTDTKGGAWADPQFAINHVLDSFDFGQFVARIKLSADRWTPQHGYVCDGPHVGRGSLVLEGTDDRTIIATPNGNELAVVNNCTIIVQHITFAAGSLNELAVSDHSRAYFGYVRWEQAKAAHIWVSRGSIVDQIGPDVIAGSAANHVAGSHGGHFRNAGWPTKFAADASFDAYAYASSHGDITYTYNDATLKPLISTNGFKVTGRRCLADLNGIVQAAALGPDFFPGDIDCFSTTSGQITQ